MATMNIAGLTPVEDPSYRYKMPRLTAKVEGRGNGIKTVLTNIIEISASLNREAPEITKYFGCEMGSQTTFSSDTERAVVNGAHTAADLQVKLSHYIEGFVLCKQCRLPETSYRIKNGIISQKCAACGSKESCDMTHKLTTFIANQHKKAKAEKGEKTIKKKEKKAKEEENSANGEENDNDKEAKKVKKEKKKKKRAENDEGGNEDGEGGEEEETDSKAVDASIERFMIWKAQNPTPTTEQIIEELWSVQTCNGLPAADRAVIFIGSEFSETAIVDNLVQKHRNVLSVLAGAGTGSVIQQRQLIAAVEWFCGTRYPKLLRSFPIMLKQLYDEEIVEEDTLLTWGSDYARNDYSVEQSLITFETLEQLKIAAQPFLTWLEEAEEEDDDDEEEEES
mmetsp:Transcript_31845/g.32456  ORF Transcript_31845/g.32456 Transcript_31845/m.32456 type:complete len:394 (+) Transcript_31845:131-1312(+)